MAQLAIGSADLPFEVEIKPLFHGPFEKFIQDNAAGYKPIRILGSDTIVKTIRDGHVSRLSLCHYGIIIRPIVDLKEVNAAIASLPAAIQQNFTYDIIGHQQEAIEARKVRSSIQNASIKSKLTPAVVTYIEHHSLYT